MKQMKQSVNLLLLYFIILCSARTLFYRRILNINLKLSSLFVHAQASWQASADNYVSLISKNISKKPV